MALFVVTSEKKLRPYFQSHSNVIITYQHLHTVIQNTNQSGKLAKLGEHDISYKILSVENLQVLVDFIIELALELKKDMIFPSEHWILHVDGSSSNKASEVGVHLQYPTCKLIQ